MEGARRIVSLRKDNKCNLTTLAKRNLFFLILLFKMSLPVDIAIQLPVIIFRSLENACLLPAVVRLLHVSITVESL